MLSVLVVEDSQEKRKAIAEVIAVRDPAWILTTSVDVVDAKKALSQKRFDLLILDIHLPLRSYADPSAEGGLEVLRWLRGRGRAHRPHYIVGTTAYEESQSLAESEFGNLIWRVVPVNPTLTAWRSALETTLVDIEEQTRPPFRGDGTTYHTDILVVAALPEPELTAVLKLLHGVERIAVEHDSSTYYRGHLKQDRRILDVVAVAASDKGMTGTAIAAMKGINAFWPRYVYMPGITAGVTGRTEIGDVIFGDLSWDWGSGKIKEEGEEERFLPAPYQRRLDETLSQAAKKMALDQNVLLADWLATEVAKPKIPPKVRVGAIASGASVLQSSAAVRRVIDQHKDVLAIEMEAFSLMFACQAAPMPRPLPIVAKAVCDNGDIHKDDDWQKFAAFTSAKIFEKFALTYLYKENVE